jgi:hypothetical protein
MVTARDAIGGLRPRDERLTTLLVVPRIEATQVVAVPCDVAFRLSQTYGEIRYRWDPFVKEQHLMDGAVAAGKGVRTSTTSRHGLHMVSEYVTYRPPGHVGMRMVEGPWFFQSFSGGWNFVARDDGGTDATWRYNFTIRPRWLRPVADPIGRWLLGRDIEKRLGAFARACADPSILEDLQAGPG